MKLAVSRNDLKQIRQSWNEKKTDNKKKKKIIQENEMKQHEVPSEQLLNIAAANIKANFTPLSELLLYVGENTRHFSYDISNYRYSFKKVFSRIYGIILINKALYWPQE